MSRWLWLALCLGCSVPQDIKQQTPGLWTNGNKFAAPAGSLSRADNARCEKPGLYSQRKGYQQVYATGAGPVIAIGEYAGGDPAGAKVVIQYQSAINRDGLSYPTANGPPVTWAVGYPQTRFIELFRRLYATTDLGVRRFEFGLTVGVSAFTNDAGRMWAPDILSTSAASGATGGFLANGSSVIYRIAWGYTDTNGYLIMGAPSGPITITNSTGGAANVVLNLIAPEPVNGSNLPNSYYIYRSTQVAGTPSDDVFLTAQGKTNSIAYGGTFSVTDITPDALLGDALYTNATQEGALAANFQPPYAADMVFAFNKLFFLQTRARPAFQLNLIATSPLRVGDTLAIAGTTFTLSASTTSSTQVALVTSGSASSNVETTARNIANAVSMASNIGVPVVMYGHYISSSSDAPGQIWVEAIGSGSATFSTPTFSTPTLSVAIGGLVRASGTTVTATTSTNHNLSVGDVVTVTCSDANFGTGSRTVATTPTATTFTYAQSGSNVSSTTTATVKRTSPDPSSAFVVDMSPQLRAYQKNGIAWSKDGEPDAVPETNYGTIGSQDAALLHGVYLRDSLFLFKQDGLWRANDDGQGGINLQLVDSRIILRNSNLAAVLHNNLYAFVAEGVALITEGGIGSIISIPVNAELNTAIQANLSTAFMWADDASGQLRIEDGASQSYVYNVVTQCWTHHTRANASAYVSKSITQDSLSFNGTVCGPVLVGDTNDLLLGERGAGDATDFQESDGSAINFDIKYNPTESSFSDKHFSEAQFLLQDSTASTVTAKFTTDRQTTEQDTTITIDASYANGPIRTSVPQETARGSYIEVGISHAVAGEQINIAGMEVDVGPGSGRTRQ